MDQVIEIPENELLPPPDLGSKFKSNFIESVIKKDDNFILVVNIQQVFSSQL